MTEASLQALRILRSPDHLQWYVVPLLVFVVYVYVAETARKNWSAVLLGICAWAAELIWEMFNASILHFSGYAPLWSTPGGGSAYVIYVGLNIEIAFFFAVAGVIVVKSLPADRGLKILGIPNRLLIPFGWGLLAVFVEVLLNRAGLLVWDYAWWSWPNIWLIVAAYCLPWYGLAWAHDRLSLRAKAIGAGILPPAAILCHLMFACWLRWV